MDWTERKREEGGGRGGGGEEGQGGGEAEGGGGGGGARGEGRRSRRSCEGYKIGSTSCSMVYIIRVYLEPQVLHCSYHYRYMYIKISLYLDVYLHSQKKSGNSVTQRKFSCSGSACR